MITDFTSLKKKGYKPLFRGSDLRYYYETKVKRQSELHESVGGIVYATADLDDESCKTMIARVLERDKSDGYFHIV